eukprot:CAMPEP_0172409538 /NCGR_PEP_ID=MMETSP1061-20121228/76416_1 /TAXON_ID=37318 /ORGANISM="Pseudo-nitzschia pungens, Strain cf. pungens" /LENGTH=136 /DNA_ID=CAMNT_0013145693 /DNA_START=1637 /DNA_END=2043 /DNA_ORIENTATION=-
MAMAMAIAIDESADQGLGVTSHRIASHRIASHHSTSASTNASTNASASASTSRYYYNTLTVFSTVLPYMNAASNSRGPRLVGRWWGINQTLLRTKGCWWCCWLARRGFWCVRYCYRVAGVPCLLYVALSNGLFIVV